MLLLLLVSVILVNTGVVFADEISSDMRKQQVFIFFCIYFICTLFLTVNYLPHLIWRVSCLIMFSSYIVSLRNNMGDTSEAIANLIFAWVIMFI